MERILIGKGHEHKVYQSKREHLVLKTPTLLNQIYFWIFKFDPSIIRDEHQQAKEMVSQTNVDIPQFRVFTFKNWKKGNYLKKPWRFFYYRGRGYVTVQEKIFHRQPQFDVRQELEKQNLHYLSYRYQIHPENFLITGAGRIYYVDPTKSVSLSGILDRKGILPSKKYAQISIWFKNKLKIN